MYKCGIHAFIYVTCTSYTYTHVNAVAVFLFSNCDIMQSDYNHMWDDIIMIEYM